MGRGLAVLAAVGAVRVRSGAPPSPRFRPPPLTLMAMLLGRAASGGRGPCLPARARPRRRPAGGGPLPPVLGARAAPLARPPAHVTPLPAPRCGAGLRGPNGPPPGRAWRGAAAGRGPAPGSALAAPRQGPRSGVPDGSLGLGVKGEEKNRTPKEPRRIFAPRLLWGPPPFRPHPPKRGVVGSWQPRPSDLRLSVVASYLTESSREVITRYYVK